MRIIKNLECIKVLYSIIIARSLKSRFGGYTATWFLTCTNKSEKKSVLATNILVTSAHYQKSSRSIKVLYSSSIGRFCKNGIGGYMVFDIYK